MRIVPGFGFGCALWLVWKADLIRSRAKALALAGLSAASLVATVGLGGPDFVSVLACGGLVLGLGAAARHGARLLSNPVLVRLGEASFALYMVSIPLQLVVTTGLQKVHMIDPAHMPLGLWLLMVAATVPAGLLFHHLVERPARTWMRQVRFGKRSPKLVLEPVE